MEAVPVVKLLFLLVGLFLVFFPKSPISLILLKSGGPRMDIENLTRREIGINGLWFLAIANISLILTTVAWLFFDRAKPSATEEMPYIAAMAVPGIACFLSLFAAFASLLSFIFRRARYDDQLIRKRLGNMDIPPDLDGDRLRQWLEPRNVSIQEPAKSTGGAERLVGKNPKIMLICMGIFLCLSGIGMACVMFFGNGPSNKPINWAGVGVFAGMNMVGGLMIYGAVKLDRKGRR
jgi:hypothetical protein